MIVSTLYVPISGLLIGYGQEYQKGTTNRSLSTLQWNVDVILKSSHETESYFIASSCYEPIWVSWTDATESGVIMAAAKIEW